MKPQLKIAQQAVDFHGVTVYVMPDVNYLTMQEDGYIQQWISMPTFENKAHRLWVNRFSNDGRIIAVADVRLVRPESSMIELNIS